MSSSRAVGNKNSRADHLSLYCHWVLQTVMQTIPSMLKQRHLIIRRARTGLKGCSKNW